MLQQAVHTENSVIRLDDGRGDLRASPHREADLGFFTVIHRKPLQHETTEAGAGATTARIVDHEALQTGAIVRELADAVEYQVHDFFTDRIMPTCKVVSCI